MSALRSKDAFHSSNESSQSSMATRKGMALLGNNEATKPSQTNPDPRNNETSIAPWEDPPSGDSIAPWDQDPQSQMIGSRPFNQHYFNESVRDAQPSPFRPNTSRTNTSDSPDFDADARRPSIASATTVSSTGSKGSNANGRFHKSLKGFFGDEPQSDSRKGSFANLPEQAQNGSEKPAQRNNSVQTQNTVEERPRTPLPSGDVTPWDYQNFEDVSRFGSAPIRQESVMDNSPSGNNQSSLSSFKRGLLHRHSKSKDEPPRSQQVAPTSVPKGPSTSRESSTSNLAFSRSTPQSTTPMSSTSALPRNSSPTPGNRKDSAAQPEKRGIFSKLKNRHKDKQPPQPEPIRTETIKAPARNTESQ